MVTRGKIKMLMITLETKTEFKTRKKKKYSTKEWREL